VNGTVCRSRAAQVQFWPPFPPGDSNGSRGAVRRGASSGVPRGTHGDRHA
jgi:hypothetical protein